MNQDPIICNKQHSTTFWEQMSLHYNHLKPDGYAKWSPKSLKTKWGIIKHDVSKFVGVYGSVYFFE